MEERNLQFQEYEKKLADILRIDKDINFLDEQVQIEELIWFYINFYSDKKYPLYFSENDRQSINRDLYSEVAGTLNEILETHNWQAGIYPVVQQWKETIKTAYNILIERGYLSRLQSAVAADPKRQSRVNEEAEKQQQKIITSLEENSKLALADQEKFVEQLKRSKDVSRQLIQKLKETEQKAEKSLTQQIESSYGSVFLARAEAYNKAATRWLLGLGIFGCIFILFAAYVISWSIINATVVDINPIIAALKFGSLLVGVYILQILNRNYSANKHLSVTNLHRASILAIVNEMARGVSEVEFKEFIMTYGVKTIFDSGETGYINRNYGAGSSSDESALMDQLVARIRK